MSKKVYPFAHPALRVAAGRALDPMPALILQPESERNGGGGETAPDSSVPCLLGQHGGCLTGGLDTGFVALGYAKVGVLGIVQGITELLPISSTAHMRIVPALLGWRDPGSAFSAAMQLAALAPW